MGTSTADDLDDLAQAAIGGDQAALEQVLRLVQPQVLGICRRMLPYGPDAEDAAQEAMISVAMKISSFAGRSRFSTWVHTVASNSARSTYRRMKTQAQPVETTGWHERPNPRTTSVIAGTRLDLLDALERLEREHPLFVTPLVLRDVYGLPYEEIATEVGAPLSTVKSRIHGARALVRPLLRGGTDHTD